MDFQIRDAVLANVKGENVQILRETVEDAIARGDEHLLPGLGVLFEQWWTASSQTEQDHFLKKLENVLH